jgi:hypothetical protein
MEGVEDGLGQGRERRRIFFDLAQEILTFDE